jgi:HK97 family phage prohead protease
METKKLDVDLCELKSGDGTRSFSGYASVFAGVDSYGDTIAPGAFTNTLQNRKRPIRMRWNHTGPVVGKFTRIEQDEKGLFVEGHLTPGHSVADDVYASLKHGAVDGLSIGFRVRDSKKTATGRILTDIDLVEISIVEEPADSGALVGGVKNAELVAMLERANTPEELERVMTNSTRLSPAEAKALISQVRYLITRGEREISSLVERITTNKTRYHA